MTITLTLTEREALIVKRALVRVIPLIRARAAGFRVADECEAIVKRIADALNAGAEVREALDLAAEDVT